MSNFFEVKQCDHYLRDDTRFLQQAKVRSPTDGLLTIFYLGDIWNDLPVHMKNVQHMEPYEFISLLLSSSWEPYGHITQ